MPALKKSSETMEGLTKNNPAPAGFFFAKSPALTALQTPSPCENDHLGKFPRGSHSNFNRIQLLLQPAAGIPRTGNARATGGQDAIPAGCAAGAAAPGGSAPQPRASARPQAGRARRCRMAGSRLSRSRHRLASSPIRLRRAALPPSLPGGAPSRVCVRASVWHQLDVSRRRKPPHGLLVEGERALAMPARKPGQGIARGLSQQRIRWLYRLGHCVFVQRDSRASHGFRASPRRKLPARWLQTISGAGGRNLPRKPLAVPPVPVLAMVSTSAGSDYGLEANLRPLQPGLICGGVRIGFSGPSRSDPLSARFWGMSAPSSRHNRRGGPGSDLFRLGRVGIGDVPERPRDGDAGALIRRDLALEPARDHPLSNVVRPAPSGVVAIRGAKHVGERHSGPPFRDARAVLAVVSAWMAALLSAKRASSSEWRAATSSGSLLVIR